MTLVEIKTQFERIFDGDPWYGLSLMAILRKVNPEGLNQKAASGHSLGQIWEHLLAWRSIVIKRMQGDMESQLVVDSEEDWKPEPVFSEADYSRLLAETAASQAEILRLLSIISEEQMDAQLPNRNFALREMVEGLIQHDLYHIGQIALLK